MKIVDNSTDIILIGYLSDTKGDTVKNALVRVFEEHTFLSSATTDNKGYFKVTIPTTGLGIRHLRIVFDGNENYNCCEVKDIDVTVREPSIVSKLKLETNKTNYQLGERVELTVTCKSQYNELLSNIPITITANNVLDTVITNREGIAKTKITPDHSGNLSLKANCGDIESNILIINVAEGNIYEIIAGLNDKIEDTSHSIKVNFNQEQANKNVVTDSDGNITTEAKPTIPSSTSELTNDSGYITDQSLSNYVTTNDSRLSDARTPTSHTHVTGEIKDPQSSLLTALNITSDNATQKVINKAINDNISALNNLELSNLINADATHLYYSPDSSEWGMWSEEVNNVKTALDLLKGFNNDLKADLIEKLEQGDAVTSITLVPKSEDNTGAIKLYYGDES